jgi:hypothetical protein
MPKAKQKPRKRTAPRAKPAPPTSWAALDETALAIAGLTVAYARSYSTEEALRMLGDVAHLIAADEPRGKRGRG